MEDEQLGAKRPRETSNRPSALRTSGGARASKAGAPNPTPKQDSWKSVCKELFGDDDDDESDAMDDDRPPTQELRQSPTQAQDRALRCPLNTCPCNHSSKHPGWVSEDALRAQIDQHTMGVLPGLPPEEWLRAKRLAVCKVCQCTVSIRTHGCIHSRCWPKARETARVFSLPENSSEDDDLPELQEIFTTKSPTREFLPKSLVPLARGEYGKLVSSVLQHNRKDAWDPCPPTDLDSANERSKAQARRAWLELLMFPKCVLRTHKRGQRAQQAYHVAKALLLRWKAGERLSLWCEIPESTGARKKGAFNATKARHEQVVKLVGLGRLSQALQRLTSPGLAENTAQVRAKLLAKFPPCPGVRPEESATLPPPPEEIEATSVAKAIRSFAAGAGPGPNGLRPDWGRMVNQYCRCSGSLLSSWPTGKPPRGCERGSVGEPSSGWAKEEFRLRMTRAPSSWGTLGEKWCLKSRSEWTWLKFNCACCRNNSRLGWLGDGAR